MEIDLVKELRSITGALNESGIEYALCGGLAMAIHGLPRATIDIDLLILTDDFPLVSGVVGQLGYTIKGLPMTFSGGKVEIRCVSKVDSASGELVRLDLLLVTEELGDVWRSRQQIAWQDDALSVVSREGLIKLKSLRANGQDLDDIEFLKGSKDED